MEGGHDSPLLGLGWAASLAGSLVHPSPLPQDAACALQEAFPGQTVMFVMAQGTPEEDGLDATTIQPTPAGPLQPAPLVPPGERCAALLCLERQALVRVDASTPDRDQLADWRHLQATAGATWLLAAPLVCPDATMGGGGRLLGAVLVAGRGKQPTTDERWLEDWACEMACLIQHASVQLMEAREPPRCRAEKESYLEMLGFLFPPRALEQLTGLADVLRGSAAVASSHGAERSVTSVSTPHAIPSSSRSSFEERSAGHLPPLSPPRPVPAEPWSVAAGQRGAAPEVSPFALQASALEGTSSPPPGPLSPVALSPTAALLRQPSRGSVASAVLRQLSLQSDLSRVLEGIDNQPLSPLDCEVTGFEDLLAEDQHSVLRRRPSLALERAHSRPQPPLDATIAAAVEDGGGLPAAVNSAESRGVEAAAAASADNFSAPAPAGPAPAEGLQLPAAEGDGLQAHLLFDQRQPAAAAAPTSGPAGDAGSSSSSMTGGGGAAAAVTSSPGSRPPLPRAVRVPWRPKPLLHALGSDELLSQPLLSPLARGPGAGSAASFDSSSSSAPPPSSFASAARQGSGGSARRGGGGSGDGSTLLLSVTYSRSAPGALQLAGLPSPAAAAAAAPVAASAPADGTAAPAVTAGQEWDLTFAAPALEAQFRRWISPYLLRSDVGLGAVPAVAVCLAACKLAHTGLTAGALALLAGALLLVASTFLPAWMGLAAWQARRTAATAALRLVGTLLFAWHLAVAAAPAPGAAGTLEALLVDSGALALLLLPIRYKLPFATHLPLSLVSLWLASLAASLRGARPWAVPLTATIAAQLLTCALSAALVYRTESALRAHFLLRSRRAAACLSGGRARRIGLPPAQPAPLAAGGQE